MQYSVCGKPEGGNSVFLTYFVFFSGGQYKLGGSRGTRGEGEVKTPQPPPTKPNTACMSRIEFESFLAGLESESRCLWLESESESQGTEISQL